MSDELNLNIPNNLTENSPRPGSQASHDPKDLLNLVTRDAGSRAQDEAGRIGAECGPAL